MNQTKLATSLKLWILVPFSLVLPHFFMPLSAQVIWIEPFTYANGTTTGANNNTGNPANDWTATCATCLAGDWYAVMGNLMEGLDTNGPATLETEVIDISSLVGGAEFTMDLSESGSLEGCPLGVSSGCISVDWIRVEYNIDGAGYVDATSVFGGPCAGACAGATYVTFDDFAPFNFQQCPFTGSTLQIRISVQCWASDEFLRIDNLVVQGQTCPLPIELVSFTARDNGSEVILDWAAAAASTVDYFEVQRSLNGTHFITSGTVESASGNELSQYEFVDYNSFTGKVWYRLRVAHHDGTESFSEVRELVRHADDALLYLFPNPATETLTIETEGLTLLDAEVKDLTGRVVLTVTGTGVSAMKLDLHSLSPGLYLVDARTENGRAVGKFILH